MADPDDTSRTPRQMNDDLTVHSRVIYETINSQLADRERIEYLEAEVADLHTIVRLLNERLAKLEREQ